MSKQMDSQKMDPVFLEVIEDEGGYALAFRGQVLLTADDKMPIRHSAVALIEHIISEFDGQGKVEITGRQITGPQFFGAYSLYKIQKQLIENGTDELSSHFELWLINDPVLQTVAGPESVEQLARYSPVTNWLGEGYSALLSLTFHSLLFHGEDESTIEETVIEKAKQSEEVAELLSVYRSRPPEVRSVVAMLSATHNGSVLFAMSLVLGQCTPSEYAQGIMACNCILTDTFDIDDTEHKKAFEGLRDDARTALEYIQFYRQGTPTQRSLKLIETGENALLEFKSTLRWNLHTDKKDDAITYASLKTIAAFLNSKGGKLLIGVADNGEIIGIEKDGFANEDKFQLHLINMIKQILGQVAATLVGVEIMNLDQIGKSICLVECAESPQPIFFQAKGKREEFYVRTGPATTSLDMSKMVEYMQDRFGFKMIETIEA